MIFYKFNALKSTSLQLLKNEALINIFGWSRPVADAYAVQVAHMCMLKCVDEKLTEYFNKIEVFIITFKHHNLKLFS